MTSLPILTVKISTDFPREPLMRQTSKSRGEWGNCRFVIDQRLEHCDAWVVYNSPLQVESTVCPPQNIILITGEPPLLRSYHPRYLSQFSTVVTCQPALDHPRAVHRQQALPWHFGVRRPYGGQIETGGPDTVTYDYDALAAMNSFPKEKLISVVCSDKRYTPDQRLRLAFVDTLKRHFGSRICHFGTGFTPIPDKADAILPYYYHVVMENSCIKDYWTEKLADCYLGGAYPLYYGCPNLAEYFPADAFSTIDITNPDQAIKTIEEALNRNYWGERQAVLREARSLVLDKYNLFAVLNRLCSGLPRAPTEQVTIRPERDFVPPPSFLRRAIRYGLSWRVAAPLRTAIHTARTVVASCDAPRG